MTKETALQVSMRTNLRRRRAEMLAHEIMRRAKPFIHYEARESFFYSLRELFEEEGVEVLTEHDRQQLGLSPRGPDGWTIEEMMALEKMRLDLLTRPLPPVVIPAAFSSAD